MWISGSPGPAGALLPAPPPRLTWQTAVGGWGAALSRSSRWSRASWDTVMSSPLEGAAGWGDRWGQGSLLKGTCRETIPLSKYSPLPPGLAPRRGHLTGDWGPAGNSCPSLATGGRLPGHPPPLTPRHPCSLQETSAGPCSGFWGDGGTAGPQPASWEPLKAVFRDRKSTRLNSSHRIASRMPSSA